MFNIIGERERANCDPRAASVSSVPVEFLVLQEQKARDGAAGRHAARRNRCAHAHSPPLVFVLDVNTWIVKY